MGVEAPDWQGVETQEYLLYFKFSQRSQAGWIGAQKCEFILKPALSMMRTHVVKIPIGS
jgi:hypothetical protein